MDRKQMCVANVQYKKPSDDGAKQSKNLLRYLTYRESRDEAARHVAGRERWVNHGMGDSVAEIAQCCDDLKSEHVLTFSLVCNPNPDLMAMIAPEDREQFVRELTERMVNGFFDERGLDTGVEFSYVLHHRLTDDPQTPGLHDPHTHIVLPGTVYDEEHGQRVPLFFSRNRKVNHIDLLHDVTERTMAEQMERYVGPDWEQRYDELTAVREQERAIAEAEPHGTMLDDKGASWDVWCGTRRTDEQQTAVGFYRWYAAATEDDPDAHRLEFRPLVGGLPHEQAAFFAQSFAQAMNGEMDKLQELAGLIGGMSADQREVLIAEMGGYEQPTRDVSPEFEL
ncbi:MAG: hypothetical protein F9K27_12335 [Anaerolineae bacterium]|nr:MAG: hypothetical protein F9K27_12335 [Anaerolineae bacterium]